MELFLHKESEHWVNILKPLETSSKTYKIQIIRLSKEAEMLHITVSLGWEKGKGRSEKKKNNLKL